MDRASGSGVFARDPDALLDLIELGLPEALIKEEQNKAVCNICYDLLVRSGKAGGISQDDMVTAKGNAGARQKRAFGGFPAAGGGKYIGGGEAG